MGLVETSDCPYNVSSIYLVLKVFESPISQDARNITEFVQSCPDVCNVIVGYGNPDLAGIGVS